jgi:hypothetical protein
MAKVLQANCSAVTCHGTSLKPPTISDLDLASPGVGMRIYNRLASYKGVEFSIADNPGACPSTAELLLDPAGLDTSLMWTKVTGAHSCGDLMPSGVIFDPAETACYLAWLEGIIANPGGASSQTP